MHLVDFGLPVKVGGVWIHPGDLVHADQHGAVTIPAEIAAEIPAAAARLAVEERQIIAVCQSLDFALGTLKAVYRQVRPGTY